MRVLIAEDEKRLSLALEEILRQEKYMTDAVDNGPDALAYAQSGIYDCVILDIMLPGMDGLEVLRHLREEKNTTPVLLLTARDTVQDKVKGLDYGADDYMTKPFSPEELLARIRVITRRTGELVLDQMSFADLIFTLSPPELSCQRTGQSVKLNFKESQLLNLFMKHPQRIYSKEELITRVWGYDSDAGDNNVEAYVSFLRKKFAFIGSTCQLIARKKIGYKLENNDAEKTEA